MFNHFKMGTKSLHVWLYPVGNYENGSNHLGLALFWGKITRNTTWISPTHNLHEKNEYKIFISVVFSCQGNNYPSTTICGVQQDQLQILRRWYLCNIWSHHTLQLLTRLLMNEFSCWQDSKKHTLWELSFLLWVFVFRF